MPSKSASLSPLLRSPIASWPQVHQITLPLPAQWLPHDHVHVYLIEADPLTLVDTGVRSEASQAVLEAALDGLGLACTDLERVIVTHAHRDHMGLLETLRRGGADVECLAHEQDADRIEDFVRDSGDRFDQETAIFSEHGVPDELLGAMESDRLSDLDRARDEAEDTRVDRRLRDGDRVEFKDFALQVRHSPGHTQGHILLEDLDEQILFTGDQVMAHAIPSTETFYTSEYPSPGDRLGRRPRFKGLSAMRRSLRQLRGRSFKTLLPGYGGVIRRPDRAIRETLLFYEVRIQRIERGLRHLAAMGQGVTAFDLWKSLYPDNESESQRRAHLLTLIGALDCLEEDGDVFFERRDDGVLTVRHC